MGLEPERVLLITRHGNTHVLRVDRRTSGWKMAEELDLSSVASRCATYLTSRFTQDLILPGFTDGALLPVRCQSMF